jgi:uncharacterized protein (TIGR00255 family)
MTGFGSSTGDICGYHCRIEIKTLNNRFKEFVFRSPHTLCQIEESLKKQINTKIDRGRVEIWITIEEGPQIHSTLNLNMELAKTVFNHLTTIKEELGIDDPITLEHLLKHNVITVDKTSDLLQADTEQFLEGILALNEIALDQLVKMRQTEGQRLSKDLLDRLANIVVWLDELTKLSETVPLAATKRYQARMEELAETILDPNRLYQEAVIMAEKMDITEEITRFGSHILGLKALLENSHEPVGRRLEFLLQEVGREINTIGSKSQSKNIIDLVVSVKSELEKIREQCMNIE